MRARTQSRTRNAIYVRLPPDIMRELRKIAAGRSLAEVIRGIVERVIQRKET